jgi:NMD protein affecting ribosome stability and mRNA decay
MTDNVIHLAFKSPHMVDDTMSFIACRECLNKTYTLIEDKPGHFPLMRCAACGQHMGRMGWYHDEDPASAS